MLYKEYYRNGDVFLIDEDGTSLGQRTATEARELAQSKNLKLVEVNATTKPPTVKILDIGKAKYDKNKNKRKPKTIETKTLQITVGTSEHDLATKANKIDAWLADGCVVLIKVSLMSRQIGKPELGHSQLKDLLAKITNTYTISAKPQLSGNSITMTITTINVPASQQT